jgi:hypothetical protein
VWQLHIKWPNSWNYGHSDFNQCVSCNRIGIQEFNIIIGFVSMCTQRGSCIGQLLFYQWSVVPLEWLHEVKMADSGALKTHTQCTKFLFFHWRFVCDAQCLECELWDHHFSRRQFICNVIRLFSLNSLLCSIKLNKTQVCFLWKGYQTCRNLVHYSAAQNEWKPFVSMDYFLFRLKDGSLYKPSCSNMFKHISHAV